MTRTTRNRREGGRRAAMRRRILAAYDAAPENARRDGETWYETARMTASAIAGAHGHLTPRHVAGIVAALSPRVSWGSNVAGAYRLAEAASRGWPEPIVAGTRSNRRKAWAIADGGDPETILGGPKVRAFFANLLGDDDAVTVDVWAARAAEGEWREQAPSGRRYLTIAQAYRDAAALRGVTPRTMQATVWCAVRGGSSLAAAGYVQPSIWSAE
jgi:hypothetical protein